jgi:hypothetical protein
VSDAITAVGLEAFYGCDALTAVYVNDLAAWCNISFAGSNYDYATSNPLYCAKNLYVKGELVTELVIPNGVKKLNNYAFAGCTSITGVVVPDSVASIGSWSFFECSNLAKADFADGMTEIGTETFYGCEQLSEIILPKSVTKIGNFAFASCPRLADIYYRGSESDWEQITVNWWSILEFSSATIHYNFVKQIRK